MRRTRSRSSERLFPRFSTRTGIILGLGLLALLIATGWVVLSQGRSRMAVGLLFALIGVGIGLAVGSRWERSTWSSSVRTLTRHLSAFLDDPGESWELPTSPPIAELGASIHELQSRFLNLRGRLEADRDDIALGSGSGEIGVIGPTSARLTRSGTYEPPILDQPAVATGEFSTVDMINRLDPKSLRWLDSSLSEQLFLGWSLDQLKEKSFLDIVQEDDRRLAKQQFRAVLERGEGHGLIYRITTGSGETRAVELNIGARYGADHRVLHLRCHLADVTARLRDETELKRRTQELTQTNDELRRTNRKLEKLKDRYSDLYENAPAMYFTVDRRGQFLECNATLVRTLGYTRKELIGRSSAWLQPPGSARPIAEAIRPGPIEYESEWRKADGEIITVWVTGSAIPDADGEVRHIRYVAQDVTARRQLEAELQIKNDRLAMANAELSAKNKELDEFTYVVSHDIQEPLRTLIGFSDFLMRDQSDKLDETGKEYVRYLVEASRRLRSLIQDLLALSRAGKITGDFDRVDLDEVVDRVKADLAGLTRSKNATIRVAGPLPVAWGDRDRIGQLLTNLVSNGLKYNKNPDPRVEIRASTDEASPMVTVSVIDNGIGIDPRFHDKIFRLFRRLHTREEYEGTGAGLAICQKIVQAHGGRIWVENQTGGGSTFRFTLPGIGEGQPLRPDESSLSA